MTQLVALVLDGPCAGSYDIACATRRMVFTRAADGRTYALDEPGDQVQADEEAFLYETDGSIGWLCGHGPGLPARSLTFQITATMDPATGEIAALTAEQLAADRRAGRERVLAWASGERDGGRSRGTPASHPVAPTQEALFT